MVPVRSYILAAGHCRLKNKQEVSMYTYTTPTITCNIEDVLFTNVDFVRIAFKSRKGYVLREVPIADIDTSDGTTLIKLTQEETALLGDGQVAIQARIHYTDGTVQATNKVVKPICDVLDKVVI